MLKTRGDVNAVDLSLKFLIYMLSSIQYEWEREKYSNELFKPHLRILMAL